MFKKNKNKIIILGKNGFIASSIISELKLNKFSIKSFSKKELNLLINKDLKKLENKIKKNDILLFCSSVAPVKNLKMFYQNIKMSENFLKTKNLNKLSAICYLSSDAVFSDSKQKLIESSIKEPNNLHGLMHLTREKLLKLSHKEVFNQLRKNSIGVNLHYIPVHTQPYYQSLGFNQGQFPRAESYYRDAISIPLFPSMTNEQQDLVVNVISKVLAEE